MAQTFAPHFRLRHFNAALVADHAAVLHALVLATETLPVCNGSEDPRAEQAIAFGFERAIVNRFRLSYFTVRPLTDLFRRSERDANRLEVRRELRFLLMKSKHFNISVVCCLLADRQMCFGLCTLIFVVPST